MRGPALYQVDQGVSKPDKVPEMFQWDSDESTSPDLAEKRGDVERELADAAKVPVEELRGSSKGYAQLD